MIEAKGMLAEMLEIAPTISATTTAISQRLLNI
jgi:hypothetical protein